MMGHSPGATAFRDATHHQTVSSGKRTFRAEAQADRVLHAVLDLDEDNVTPLRQKRGCQFLESVCTAYRFGDGLDPAMLSHEPDGTRRIAVATAKQLGCGIEAGLAADTVASE